MDYQKVRSEKENSRMHQNYRNTLSWVEDTKTLKAFPMNGMHQKHPLANQKLLMKLPCEFRSSTNFPVKYSIMKGLPVGLWHKGNPVSCEENFPMELTT